MGKINFMKIDSFDDKSSLNRLRKDGRKSQTSTSRIFQTNSKVAKRWLKILSNFTYQMQQVMDLKWNSPGACKMARLGNGGKNIRRE